MVSFGGLPPTFLYNYTYSEICTQPNAVLRHSSRQSLCNPMDCSPPGSSVHGILQARILEWITMPSSRDLPNPGIEPRSLSLRADSLPSEPPGKPKNTGMGSLPLLQGNLLP